MALAPSEPGQHLRAGGSADAVWGILDMTPKGRGGDWFPKVCHR
ncbi:hypothetical protein [Phenylobacterium immobile]|nr:hypothetical protein [Phenylobacterium immobile]